MGRRTDGMYGVDFKKFERQQALAAQEKDISVLDVWCIRLTRAAGCNVKRMAVKDVVRDRDMRQRSVPDA